MICSSCGVLQSVDLRGLPSGERLVALRRILHEIVAELLRPGTDGRPGSGVTVGDVRQALQSITLRIEAVENRTLPLSMFLAATDIDESGRVKPRKRR